MIQIIGIIGGLLMFFFLRSLLSDKPSGQPDKELLDWIDKRERTGIDLGHDEGSRASRPFLVPQLGVKIDEEESDIEMRIRRR